MKGKQNSKYSQINPSTKNKSKENSKRFDIFTNEMSLGGEPK